MRIISLHLHRFGAVVDEHLSFSDGLNVVCGPNEAGKSTWHAAATLLLTGFPKSLRQKSVKPLYERYRPWSGGEYKISGIVELDDGRRLRIVRDFQARCSQIFEEGRGRLDAPLTADASVDLSELIGLDRATVPLVASVRQAEILELAHSASSKEGAALRDFLQRSLASRTDGDVTAESAIEAIDGYRRAHIGANKQGSNKPLRRAVEAKHAADGAYRDGVAQWEHYQRRERELEADIERSRALRDRLATARMNSIRSERSLLIDRLDEIAAIDAQLAGAVDRDTIPDDDLFDQARQLWARQSILEEELPDIVALLEQRDELRDEIESLPTAIAAGPDCVPAPVRAAKDQLDDARRYLAIVLRDKPHQRDTVGGHRVEPHAVRSAADELARPAPVPDGALRTRRDQLEQQTAHSRRGATTTMTVAVVVMIAAVICIAVGSIATLGVGFVLLGAAAIAAWRSLQIRQRLGIEISNLAAVQRRLDDEVVAVEAFQTRRRELEQIVASWGCRPTPSALRQLATQLDETIAVQQLSRRWEQRRAVAQQRCHDASEQLVAALADVGYKPNGCDTDALLEAFAQLEAVIEERRVVQDRIDRRHQLVERCALVDDAVESAERAHRRIDAYRHALDSFLTRVGVTASNQTIHDQLDSLEKWLRAGRELRSRGQAQQRLVERRDALCGPGELDRLKAKIAELDRQLAQFQRDAAGDDGSSRVTSASAPTLVLGGRGVENVAELEAEYRTVQERIDRSRGALSQLSSQLTDLTDLAEQRAKAHDDYERLARQEELLTHAQQHLNQARSRVHSAIAPQLVQATADRLALVTAGRYKRLDINPDDLSVQVEVEPGTWHDSNRLSFGTVEQIYLMLRAAIAEIIAPAAESCPLLLDDATVHADASRTGALIEVLGDLATQRQVIVFSQESLVRETGTGEGATVIDLAA